MERASAATGTARGSAVGFTVSSELPFRTLRSGAGPRTLTVSSADVAAADGAPVLAWRPRPGNPFEGRLLRTGTTYRYWANDAGWFAIDPGAARIELEHGPLTVRRELRLLGVPTTLCVLEQGDISLHASAVQVGDVAVLLAGPSRAGKTTLAAAFAAHGHRLLAEDSVRCSVTFTPVVYPGPAAVRLRPDVADALRVPGQQVVDDVSGQAPADTGRVTMILDEAARGDGRPVPLAAIFVLRSSSGALQLDRSDGPAAIRDMMALAFHLPSPSGRAAAFAGVADLARQVPAFDLVRPLRLDALDPTIELVTRHVAGG